MEYVNVESSQIEAIGFGDGFYGPETLGIKFPPTKRQPEGAEYHYANVTPRTHQALMAAPSIGSYFGQNIKAHPEQYPFTNMKVENHPSPPSGPIGTGLFSHRMTPKVEADPTEAAQSTNAGGSRSTSRTTPSPDTSTTPTTDDTPAPVTSLAVIDTLENSALFASGGVTDAQEFSQFSRKK